MKTTYSHLTEHDREQIDVLHRKGYTLSKIAQETGRSKGTISRELSRNSSHTYGCYLSHRAEQRASARRSGASQRPRLKSPAIKAYVLDNLNQDWSPEQISGRIRTDHPGWAISPEAIYQYVYDSDTPNRKELIHQLKRAHRIRRTKGLSRKMKKTKIPNRISIEQRPAVVDSRQEFGHWEGDSIVSRASKTALNSLVERVSRLVRLGKLSRKSAKETIRVVASTLLQLPPHARRTITLDNGTENAGHETITRMTGADCYFARPYHSWERGTNENTNGLVRYYLPKGTDFATISDEQVAFIENRLNNRPRKCLNFSTPNEIASHLGVALHG